MNPASASFFSLLRQLLPLVPRKEKRRFWLLLTVSVIMALSELAITGLVALLAAIFGSPEAVLDNNPVLWLRQHGLVPSEDSRLLALTALCAILLAIVWKNTLTVLQQRQLSIFSESVGAAARCHIFRFYQRAPYLWLMHHGVAELGFGLASATSLASTLNTALQIFANLLMLTTLFIGLVSVSPIPSLLFMGVLGLGGFTVIKAVRKTQDRCANASFAVDRQTSKLTHLALHDLKDMRLYCRENMLFSAFKQQMAAIVEARSRLQTVVRLPVASLEILGFGTLVLVMLFLVFVQDAGMARISGVMGFMAATAWRALPAANRLVDSLTAARSGLPQLRKVTELVLLERSMDAELLPLPDPAPDPLAFTRNIILENVSFQYPAGTAPAIKDLSLTIEAGSMVGLVGLSGAGKSTLVNLLTGLMPPSSGRILVDGLPINKENSMAWLQCIGYVSQSPYILNASLAENVALSRWGEEIDRGRVLECCRMAALDFVDELENGIDTILNDRGTRLSGGQAQRVAIARALYSDPALIIFDEATSSLDMKNEKAIHDTILSLRNQATMVIIAHRLTTVEGCDMLVWLEGGHMRRAGNVESVMPEYEKLLRSSSVCQ